MGKLTHNSPGTPLPNNHPFKGGVMVFGGRKHVAPPPIQSYDSTPVPEWDGPFEVVFSIAEESNDGGSSCCWIERRGNDFILFGNELGQMGKPCSSAPSALCSSGAEFGMEQVVIHSRLSIGDFQKACSQLNLSNISSLIINDIEIRARNTDGIMENYKPTI